MSHEFLTHLPASTLEAMQQAGNRKAYLGYYETVNDQGIQPVEYGMFIRTLAGLKGKPPTTTNPNPNMKGGRK